MEAELVAMGFPLPRVKAAIATAGIDSVEAALEWLIANAPAEQPANAEGSVVEELTSMGFGKERAQQAVAACGAQLEAALQWLIEDGEADAGPPPPKVQRKAPAAAPAAPPPRAPPAAPPAAPAPVGNARKAAAPPPAPVAAPPAPPVAKGRPASSSSSAASGSGAVPPSNHRSLKRLMKEWGQLNAMDEQGGSRKLHAFEAGPVDESDLYTWELKLYDFERDQQITADMKARKIDHISLRIHFPMDYPNSPPFVYMLRPRLREGSGYVLNGGGICMELLTPSEWSPATSINALVMSIRAMLLVGNARLKHTSPSTKEADYGYEEAKRDFSHIVATHKKHGWTSHPMFKNA